MTRPTGPPDNPGSAWLMMMIMLLLFLPAASAAVMDPRVTPKPRDAAAAVKFCISSSVVAAAVSVATQPGATPYLLSKL